MSSELFDGNAHLSADEKALIEACKKTGDAAGVRRLLAAGVGVDIRDGHNMPWDQTPLMLAAHNGFLEIVKILLAAGASVSTVDKNGGGSEGEHQPLHHAVMGKSIEIVEAIFAAGADINALTTDGNTPLNMAIRQGNLPLIKLLIDRKAAVKKFSRKKFHPPLYVIGRGDIKWEIKPALIEMVLHAGADPNEVGPRNITPLKSLAGGHDVNSEERLVCLTLLLKAGAQDLPDKDGGTALELATLYKNKRATGLIRDALANRPPESSTSPGTPEKQSAASKSTKAAKKSEPKKPTKAGAKAKKPALGVKHFLDFVYESQPEWSLFAVQSPIESVVKAYAGLHRNGRWSQNVEHRPAGDDDDLDPSCIALVKLHDSDWTLILREILYVSEEGMAQVAADAKKLSKQLKTKAITFVGEDTSGALRYELFENGDVLEEAEWIDGGELHHFKSTLRKQPKTGEIDHKFPNKVFSDLGIYLPVCYPQAENGQAWLCVDKSIADRIERADILEQA